LTQVTCNNGLCLPGQVCCFNPIGPGDHCGQAGQCPVGYVQLTCNAPEQCPGQICCATLKNQNIAGISCKSSCSAANELIVCTTAQPNVCPIGTQCQADPSLGAGYQLCY
jgi:hypothetical protein